MIAIIPQKKKQPGVVLVTEDDYLDVLLPLLSHARSEILVMAFSFAIGSAGGRLDEKGAPFQVAQKLKEVKAKRKAGLTVRLFIEGLRETVDRNQITARFLQKAGVKVKYGSTHAKGFCIDGRYLLFGSTNLTNQSMVKNNETNLLIDDAEIAAEFKRYFEFKWKGGEHGGITLQPPLLADGAFKDVLTEMIDGAKKSIVFSIYYFDHREIEKALIAAHKRGVKITAFVAQHFAFAMSYVRRTRHTVRRLREAGLDNLHFAPGNLFTHSKYLIVDGKEVALGTGNWLVEDVVEHPQLYIRLINPALAKRLTKHMLKQIKDQATGD